MCQRGQVYTMRSDHGSNFMGAERQFGDALASLNHNKIQNTMALEGIRCRFNPPAGSHYGGVWECIIHMVRRILNTVLRQQCLDNVM